MSKHHIINTAYGEVMLKSSNTPNELDCYIGDNFDDYIGSINGTLDDDDNELIGEIEVLLCGDYNENRGEKFQK